MAKISILGIILGIIIAGLSILYFNDPTEAKFFPPCIFKTITGFYCPGCGSTRAIHSILHLEFTQAFRYNMFIFIVSPYLFYEFTAIIFKIVFNKYIPRIPMKSKHIYTLLIIIISYWVLRNINIYPFNLLAPTKLI